MSLIESASMRRESRLHILAILSLGFFVVQLDVGIVNLAVPAMAADLKASSAGLQWIVDAYTVSFAAAMPAAGAVADRLGGRRAYLAGLQLTLLASICCAAAPAIPYLIAARLMQGIAAAITVPASLSLLNYIFGGGRDLRSWAIGLWTSLGCIGLALGPVLGGAIVATATWRFVFLAALPCCTLGLIGVRQCVPPTPASEHPRGIDYAGQALLAGALTAFTMAVVQFGARGFNQGRPTAALLLAIVAAVAFLRVQTHSAKPMMPPSLFRSAGFARAVTFGTISNLAYYGMLFSLSLHLQQGRKLDAFTTGLALLPLTATFILSNLVSIPVIRRWGLSRSIVAGGSVMGLGYASLFVWNDGLWTMIPGLVLIPAGMGVAIPAAMAIVLGSVRPDWSGTASAVLTTARQCGGAVGVAVFGSVGSARAADLTALHINAAVAALLLAGVTIMALGIPTEANRSRAMESGEV